MMPILSEPANIVVVNILRSAAHSMGFLRSRVATGRPFDLAKASANSESWEFDWASSLPTCAPPLPVFERILLTLYHAVHVDNYIQMFQSVLKLHFSYPIFSSIYLS